MVQACCLFEQGGGYGLHQGPGRYPADVGRQQLRSPEGPEEEGGEEDVDKEVDKEGGHRGGLLEADNALAVLRQIGDTANHHHDQNQNETKDGAEAHSIRD